MDHSTATNPLDAPNRTHAWARCMIDECVRSGVDTFFVSPGSRSTPLTTAIAQHPEAQPVLHVDERGGAFAALGYARATGRPAGWVTTSGTAVANGMPAVAEAAQEGLPMLLLTADRPPELRGTGANQTIDQVKLFGDHVRWSADVPPPSADAPLASVLTTVDQALHHAQRPPGGPVHLNVMYRKPLHPVEQAFEIDDPAVQRWAERRTPFTTYPVPAPHAPLPQSLTEAVQQAERGLIVAGRLTDAEAYELLDWARAQHWPVLPDITSQLRLSAESPVVPHAHHIARHQATELRPDVVLHVGGRFVSKPMRHFLRDAEAFACATIRPAPLRVDPDHRCTHHIETTVAAAMDALPTRTATPASWNAQWQEANDAVSDAFVQRSENEDRPSLSEPSVARALSQHIPDTHAWMLASSMPIRDAQRYATAQGANVPVFANRGASGIDGTIATATGISIARDAPTTLLIGDLATWHDVNALALLKAHPVIAVIVNNDGGGIFHFLPIAEHSDVFEPHFTTPHGRSFKAIAKAFDLPYHQPSTRTEFADAYQAACERGTSALIEVRTDRTENADVHTQLDAHVAAALSDR